MNERPASRDVARECDDLSIRELAELLSRGVTLPLLGFSEFSRGINRTNRLAKARDLLRTWRNERHESGSTRHFRNFDAGDKPAAKKRRKTA